MGTLEKIIECLKKQGKKQKDLTDYLGLGKNTFSNWKAGHNNSYLKYINQIADFLGVSSDYLFGTKATDAEILAGLFPGINPAHLTKDKINDIGRYAKFITDRDSS